MSDEAFIKKTLKLAQKGSGYVSPNPVVGAIIVKNGEIISTGYHKKFGAIHAEVAAIKNAGTNCKNSTLYVNLEPCSHHGKQPPCTDEIIRAGIKRVVVGTLDRNPQINGNGIKVLQKNGIEVITGVLEKECILINEVFFKYITTNLPFITLKIAQTIDGKIATDLGKSKWITSEKSRKYVHKLRNQSDAVLTGIGTVLTDDPQLDVRYIKGRTPFRVILDSNLRIPLNAKLLNDEHVNKTILVTNLKTPDEICNRIEQKGAAVVKIPKQGDFIDLNLLCKWLGNRGFASVLVEGGSKVFSSFLKLKLADRISLFIAPKLLGSGIPAIEKLDISDINNCIRLNCDRIKKIEQDIFITGRVVY